MVNVTWTVLKDFVDTRSALIQYAEFSDNYVILAFDGPFQVTAGISKLVGSSDLTDFEANYKPTGNRTMFNYAGATVLTGDPARVIDEYSSTVLYVGVAIPASVTSAAVWQITRYTTTGTVMAQAYADGNAKFDNIWDNRTSLSYS